MNSSRIKADIRKADIQAAFTIFARWIYPRLRWIVQMVKAFTHTFIRKIQQPSAQYHMTFLLATILTFLLGWALFVSILPHLSPLAFTGHI
jgi:hypothetical protein